MISGAELNSYDVKGILTNLQGLTGPALVAVVFGGIVGYVLAVLIERLSAGLAVGVGMALGLVLAVGVAGVAAPRETAPICRTVPQSCRSIFPVSHPLI